MIIDDYQIWMISDLANPMSAPRREMALKSWYDQGLEPQLVQAITPDTIGDCDIKISFDKKYRLYEKRVTDFTETEKAIFYSHMMLLKQCAESSTPYAIVEDDVQLLQWFPDQWELTQAKAFTVCSRVMKLNPLRHTITPAAGYIVTPRTAKHIIDYVTSKPMQVNVDGVIVSFLDREKYDLGGQPSTWSTLMEHDPICKQLPSKSTIEHST